jgi:hypothetical protein
MLLRPSTDSLEDRTGVSFTGSPAAEELMYLLAEALEVADPLGIDRGSN